MDPQAATVPEHSGPMLGDQRHGKVECPNIFTDGNSMHEVVYSPVTHEHFWAGNLGQGRNFHFRAWKYHFHAWKFHIFMHENDFLCMKFSCHDLFMHETFRAGITASLISKLRPLNAQIIWQYRALHTPRNENNFTQHIHCITLHECSSAETQIVVEHSWRRLVMVGSNITIISKIVT